MYSGAALSFAAMYLRLVLVVFFATADACLNFSFREGYILAKVHNYKAFILPSGALSPRCLIGDQAPVLHSSIRV